MANPKKLLDGIPMRDARTSAIFTVTAADTRASRRNDPAQCAAAIACKRALHVTEVRVHLSRTYVKTDGHWERYITPTALAREIVAFDRTRAFAPGEYRITAPTMTQRLGRQRGATGPHTGRRRQRPFHHLTTSVRHAATVTTSAA